MFSLSQTQATRNPGTIMLAGNQNPFCLGHSPAFQTPTSGFQQQVSGQPTHMCAWPYTHSAPVHTYIHHVVGPSTAGNCRFPQQAPVLGQQVFPFPCMCMGPACTFVHHITSPTDAASSTNNGPFGNLRAALNQPSTSTAPAFANTAFGLTTSAPSMMNGLYWSNTRHPWSSNSTMPAQPSTHTAPAFGVKSSGPFGAPFGNTSAPSASGGMFGNSDMNVDQPSVFSAPAFGGSFAESNAGQPGDLFNASGTMFGRSSAPSGRAFGFGEPNNALVFRAVNQQPASRGNPFGTPLTSQNQPWPQPGFPVPTTHIACPACGAFVGTTVKYQPSFWIDSTAMNGVLSLVYVAHQCITCMKEYEHKSLEELRLEDYSANRKYGSKMAAGVFNTASQSASSVFSPFAPTLRPSLLFGATENGVTASPFGTSATPGPPFGSRAPPVSFSGTSVMTSSGSSAASAATVFGAPTTTSPGGPVTTRPVVASIFGSPVTTSSHGPVTASPVGSGSAFGTPAMPSLQGSTAVGLSPAFGAPVNGSTATSSVGFGTLFGVPVTSSHGPTATSSVGLSPAFGAPVNGSTATSSVGFGTLFGVPVTSSHGPTATSSVGFSQAFGTPAVFGAPAKTSSHSPTASSSAGFSAAFRTPVVTSSHGPTASSSVGFSAAFRTTVVTSSQSSTATSLIGFGPAFGATVMTSSYVPTAVSSAGFRPAFGAPAVFGAPITISSHGPTATSLVGSSPAFGAAAATSHSPTATSSVVFSPAFGAPVMTSSHGPTATSLAVGFSPAFGAPLMTSSHDSGAAILGPTSISGTPTSTSVGSAIVASPDAATIFGVPLTLHNSTKSVAARISGASVTSYSPVETSPVLAAAVTEPSATTSSPESGTANAVAADNAIDTAVTTSSHSYTATSSGIPIVSPATALFGTPMTASTCSSTAKSLGSLASPCTESTAPFVFESWRCALGTVDNGSGDGDLGDKLEANSAAPEQPSSRNTASPGTLCAICLGPLQDKSGTDSCSHTFCYTCLLEWAKVKQRCPVCKERFFKIIVQGGPSQE
ncbi:uncharacterized protein LOC144174188 isoform X5 [Haemaphysalis longicornis]